MSNVYRDQRRKTVLLYAAGTLAVGISIALIAYFVFILVLRTEYRAVCFEINECVLASRGREDSTIESGEKSCPLSYEDLDHYNQLLLDGKTVVYSRKSFNPDERSLILSFSGCRLILRQMSDGNDIGVRWETPEEVRCYTVASANITFPQLRAYFVNLYNRAESAA